MMDQQPQEQPRADAPRFAGWPWPRLGVVAVLSVVMLLLVAPGVLHAVDVWRTDEEFTYGFLIVPISAGLLWWQRARLRESAGPGSMVGLVVVLGALTLTLLSRRSGINAVGGIAVIPLLWGAVLYLWGWRTARIVAFPLVFLLFGLGLYRGLLSTLGFTLQGLTAVSTGVVAQAIGLPVVRDGLVLSSEHYSFVVAEACSGMSSLLSLLALASLWTYFASGTIPARVAVMLSVPPLVMLANTTRVTLVLTVANFFGQDAAIGFFHGASSLVLFGVALAGLLGASRLFGCRLAMSSAPEVVGA